MARFPGLPLEAKAQRNHSVLLIIGSGNSDWRAAFWQKKKFCRIVPFNLKIKKKNLGRIVQLNLKKKKTRPKAALFMRPHFADGLRHKMIECKSYGRIFNAPKCKD